MREAIPHKQKKEVTKMNANSIMMTALKTAGHYIDFANNTVYVTTQFNKKAEKYGTEECRKLTEIEKMFPNITIEVYAQKRKSTAITYDMMELFIRNMPEAANNIVEFNRVKQMSKAYKSAYKYVNDWFSKKFPFYSELTKKDDNGNVVWDAIAMYRKAQEEAQKKAPEADAHQIMGEAIAEFNAAQKKIA